MKPLMARFLLRRRPAREGIWHRRAGLGQVRMRQEVADILRPHAAADAVQIRRLPGVEEAQRILLRRMARRATQFAEQQLPAERGLFALGVKPLERGDDRMRGVSSSRSKQEQDDRTRQPTHAGTPQAGG
jgi:hypothetical protein